MRWWMLTSENHFVRSVNQILMLYILNLYHVVSQFNFNKTGRKKIYGTFKRILWPQVGDVFIYLKLNLFISIVLSLHWYPCIFLVAKNGGYPLFAVHWLLFAMAFLVVEHGLYGSWASVFTACGPSSYGSWALEHKFSSCEARTYLFLGMWDLPGPRIEPMSPELAARFFTTEPPRKTQHIYF